MTIIEQIKDLISRVENGVEEETKESVTKKELEQAKKL